MTWQPFKGGSLGFAEVAAEPAHKHPDRRWRSQGGEHNTSPNASLGIKLKKDVS